MIAREILVSLALVSVLVRAQELCEMVKVDERTFATEKFMDLSENIRPGSIATTVLIYGNTTEVKLQSDPHEFFGFNVTTRELVLLKELDVDDGAPVVGDVFINCWSLDEVNKSPIKLTLYIHVNDWNDNGPEFSQTHYTVNVSEDVKVGSTIYSGAVATDRDQSTYDNKLVTYNILPGVNSDYIGVQVKGYLTLQRQLDYESIQQIVIRTEAKDMPANLSLQKTATATVTINIQDVDDQKPKFSQLSYVGVIDSDAPLDTTVTVSPPIKAWDPDSMKVPLVYSILDGRRLFAVNNQTAEVYTTRLIDADVTSVPIGITARQSDNELMAEFTLLTINIRHTNMTAPRFSQQLYEVEKVELEPVGALIVATTVTGPSQVSMLTYAITDGGTGFSINSSGEIKLDTSLDYETAKQHLMQVTATDGKNTATATVKVTVLDQNDNSPQIQTTGTVFTRARNQGELITVIQAMDQDAGNTLRYQVRTPANLFAINEQGELKVAATSAELLKDEYSVLVVVLDDGKPPREAATSITVKFPPSGITTSSSTEPVAASLTTVVEADNTLIIILGVACGIMLVIIVLLLYIIFRIRRTKEVMYKARAPRGFIAKGLTYQKAESPDELPKINLPVTSAFGGASELDRGTMNQDHSLRPTTIHDNFIDPGSEMDRNIGEIEVETSAVSYDYGDFENSTPKYGVHLRTFQVDDSGSSGSNNSDTTSGSGRPLMNNNNNNNINNNNNNNDGVGKMTSWDDTDAIHPQGTRKCFDSVSYSKSSAKPKSDRPEITVYF